MSDLIAPGAELEHLFTGAIWSEGPLWIPQSATVRWSDIPNNRILEFDSASGTTDVFRDNAEYTNGRTLDRSGRVVQCSHGRRAIERETDTGPVTLVDHWGDARLNSPNDIVVARDSTIWFTDPPYGIAPGGVEGHPGELEYGACYVFHFDEATGDLTPVITDMVRPNGLAFSPDESILYVSDTAGIDVPNGSAHIRAYDVIDGRCVNGRIFADPQPGVSDGFRIDTEGRLWTSSGDSVQIFSPDGELLHRVPVPEKIANVCFGGPDGRDLYIAASTSLYRIRTTTTDTSF
jgi:gluconolactonase